MFQDTGALKANLKVHAFDTYVGRYAGDWGKKEPLADKQPQAAVPPPSPVASAGPEALPTGHPVDPRYDFPSAASIPPVSIMNAEPPVPKDHVVAPATRGARGRRQGCRRQSAGTPETSTGPSGDAARALVSRPT